MCGRARVSVSRQQVMTAARVEEGQWKNSERYIPSYNFSPGHDAPVVLRNKSGSREVHTMRWGLVPHSMSAESSPDHFRMFNARSETLAEKFVFSNLLQRRRCVFPCNGWYEWLKEGSRKQPYYVHVGEDRVLMMAALYDVWQSSHDPECHLETFTILTTDASKRLAWLHTRMPVILFTEQAVDAWLSGEPLDLRKFNQDLAVPYNGADLEWHKVTPELGKVTTQGPQCSKPLNQGQNIAALFGMAGGAAKAHKAEHNAPAVSTVKTEAERNGFSAEAPLCSSAPCCKAEGDDGEALGGGESVPCIDPASGPSVPLNPDDVVSNTSTDAKPHSPSKADDELAANTKHSASLENPLTANNKHKRSAECRDVEMASQPLERHGKSVAQKSPNKKRPKPRGQQTMNNFFVKNV